MTIVFCFGMSSPAAYAQDDSPLMDNAVILIYHHVDADTPPSTSVSPETFTQHLDYLVENHQVLPLPDIIDALKNQRPLPDKAVAITFDDGFRNVYTQGHPLLKARGLPYTVFVNPPRIGEGDQLTWDQIRTMQSEGAHFANHHLQHEHLLEFRDGEDVDGWMTRVLADIDEAEALLSEKLGYSLKYLAYPYGEFNRHLKAALEGKGYVAFGQQSGAISSMSDFGALPRFPAAGVYASMKTLKVKLNSMAMDITDINPVTHSISEPLGRVEFSIAGDDARLGQLNCFLNGEVVESQVDGPLVTVNLDRFLSPGRSRLNCTAPSREHRGRYYWYSHPWFVPTAEGKYPN